MIRSILLPFVLGIFTAYFLDPAADKLLLVSVYIMLGWLGELPSWLVVLVVSRDGLIVGAIILSSMMGTMVEMKYIGH